ncbi:DNA-methyltransferase [Novosphingobium sp.]|uniref:DNA-methyltransferase n=1 Tax=Novosphingobium sp. TaxID=1874826 RepID=UPI003B52C51A
MSIQDPPYNVSVTKHVGGLGATKHREFPMATGEMSDVQFSTFLIDELRLTSAFCEPGAIIMSFMDWRSIDKLIAAGKQVGLELINLCVWNKTNASMGSLYRSKHELVGIFKKPGAPHRNNVQLGRFGRYRTNVWDAAGCNSFGKNRMEELGSHPTVKPAQLIGEAIRDVSHRGEIVLDSFLGSGTTLIAAERTGRIAYGIELDPIYVDTAIRRWQAHTGVHAVLEATGETFAATAAARSETAPPPIVPPARRRIVPIT